MCGSLVDSLLITAHLQSTCAIRVTQPSPFSGTREAAESSEVPANEFGLQVDRLRTTFAIGLYFCLYIGRTHLQLR